MAILIPDTPKECGYGERRVYEKLGRDLDKDWIVLHSLGLHGHATKIWGEADIVVLSTKGIFALEVKGGKVSCTDGVWHYGAPGGAGYSRREDPWTQSKGTMFAIKELLERADDRFRHLLFGFGVVMPMETFTAAGAEIEPAVLLDRRDFGRNLGFYIGDLQRHWTGELQQKHGRAPRLPTLDDIRRARAILRPDVDSAYSIGSYLNGMESTLLQLSNDQIRTSRRMASNPRTVVRGKAGTGKTIIAVERAKQLAQQGLRVLFLCFNQLLAEHIRKSLDANPRAASIDVWHVHSLYRTVIERAGMQGRLADPQADSTELYATVFPQTFIDAALEMETPQWDALVIDEAQDLLTPDNLDAFDLILRDGLNHGRWHIFFDRLQNIYGTEIQDAVEKRLSEAQPAFDDLFENCRNTRQVAVQASMISGIDLALEGAPDGASCDNVYYPDSASFAGIFKQQVRNLLQRDVLARDIVILSTRRRENSLMRDVADVDGIPLDDVRHAGDNALAFSTIHAFKGLERKVVLVTDLDEIGQEAWAMLHYAGLSRASGLLIAFLPASARPAYAAQAAAFARRRISG
ncbi:NERD domain-containing protein [Massilia sp. R2A-15]|uniref:nuclease-related domain-containing DEAD/DEAH box helicase n=1 Tax=Massilia sp. R2A-15 TaxID=3064278 RepID=UPI002734249D|nr:NERD domain-containing protein [Massilia sp. R2A-15]WLI87841.1 NERD domain-containing protein [Massilia sp. R2A-15]